ncbi:MAG: endonuclease/exonuclease/phosphatase family protein, partial [Bacteroides sp.]|nr:endonuclease/exonuclease/phosphatase family protein [Bacteroides sp.]
SMDQVAKAIKASGAGVVSLNELDSCNLRHGTYQLEELAEATGGWECHFAQAFPFAGGAYGNGILSHKPILRSYRIALPMSDGAEQRSVAVAETRECVFASVHLDHIGEKARIEQAEYINSWFRKEYSGYRKPVILCGDMNDTPESRTIQIFMQEWEMLSEAAYTFPSNDPSMCIDYIFALKSARRIKSSRLQELPQETASASDHLPVCVSIEY